MKDKVVEGIEKLIFDYMQDAIDPSYVKGLAKAIRDSLVIDEDKIESILWKFQCDGAYASRNNPVELAKALSAANIIKVKVKI